MNCDALPPECNHLQSLPVNSSMFACASTLSSASADNPKACKHARKVETSKGRGRAWFPEYLEVLDDEIWAVMLVCQLLYWYQLNDKGKPKLTIRRANGMYWIAKTAAELHAEIGISKGQLGRAVKMLIAKGATVVDVSGYGAKKTTFYRLTCAQGASFINGYPSKETLVGSAKSTISSISKAQIRDFQKDEPELPNTDSTEETTDRELTSASASLLATAASAIPLPGGNQIQKTWAIEKTEEKPPPNALLLSDKSQHGNSVQSEPPQQAREENNTPGSSFLKASEVIAAQAAKKASVGEPLQAKGVQGLSLLWRKRVNALQQGYKELTAKEIGQLKHLHNALGPKAPEMLESVLADWCKFVWTARAKKGLTVAPEQPVVGFVLAHYDVALQLIAQPPEPPTPKVVKLVPVASTAIKGYKPGEQPMTSEEKQAAHIETLAQLEAIQTKAKEKQK